VRPTFSRSSFTLQNLTTGQPVSPSVGSFSFNNTGDHAELLLTNLLLDDNYSVTGTALPLSFFVLTGDADHDRYVNSFDFNALAANFNKTSGVTLSSGDFNYDGKVNALDFNAIAARFGTNLPAPPPATSPAGAINPAATTASLFAEKPISPDPLEFDLLS